MTSTDFERVAMNLKVGSQGAVFRKTWRNWQAQGQFWFGLSRMVPFWMWDRTLAEEGNPFKAEFFTTAKSFRIGAIPHSLPQGAEAPPAFTRNGVTYISLPHLTSRLWNFAGDLEKHRKIAPPKVVLKWEAQTRVSTLVAGAKTLEFKPEKAHNGKAAPILLRGYRDEGIRYESTLYVPLAPVVKTFGLSFKHNPKNRLFDLSRGSWIGQ